MAKSKAGPALYELYRNASKKKRTSGETTSTFPEEEPEVEEMPELAAPAEEESDDGAGDVESPAFLEISEGCLRIALSSRGGIVAVLALALLGSIAFSAGHWVGVNTGRADGIRQGRSEVDRTARDMIAAAHAVKPSEDIYDGDSPIVRRDASSPLVKKTLPELPKVSSPESSSSTTWVKGNTYIVIQEFRADAGQDAERAQEFLSRHGVESEVFDTGRGFKLITTQGYNRKDPTQKRLADKYLEKIRDIGEAYVEAGGRYRLEGYYATLRSDTW